MKAVVLKVGIFIMFIGIIALALNMTLGWNTITYLTATRHNDLIYYKLDAAKYIENIKNSFATWPKIFVEQVPEIEWSNDIANISNNFKIILNYIIFAINILIFPLRLAGYIVQSILAIIGLQIVDTPRGNPLAWLVDFTKVMMLLQIDYVQ